MADDRPFLVARIVGRATRLRRVAGQMNRLEQRYAALLDARKARGDVAEWHYEALTLKLAHDTRYTPDFLVVLADGAVELHEVKGGHFRDDAKVKARVCARAFPFCLRLARLVAGSWQIEEVPP